MPLKFSPAVVHGEERVCDIEIAVRHTNRYRYSSVNLVVDIVDSAYKVNRRVVTIPVADEYGNWKGSGFGAMYQDKAAVAAGVKLDAVRSIVVWQAMKGCDRITDINNVGIIYSPVAK